MSIQRIPSEVIAQIKSSTTLTSLNGVVFELLQNSLDAGSSKTEVVVDYSRGSCIVEDNGLGILPSEFAETGGLAKLHHSSKLSSKIPVHGGTGIFLASLSALSLLTITSHHHLCKSHNTLTMHKSAAISRQVPATPQQYLTAFEHGTRVTVRDLFGSMPVRVKQRPIAAGVPGGSSKEWVALKKSVVSLLLAWYNPISLVLKETGTDQRVVFRSPSLDLSVAPSPMIAKTCNVLSQAAMTTLQEHPFWVSVGASSSSLEIKGCICLVPRATKHCQFIAFGILPMLAINGQCTFYDEINRLFQNSEFGTEEEENSDDAELLRRARDVRYKAGSYTKNELKLTKKGVDRWPMYYINIQQINKSSNSKVVEVDDFLDDGGKGFRKIVELLRAMIFEFLTKHHFRPREARGTRPQAGTPTLEVIENMTRNPSIKTSECRNELELEKSKLKEFNHLGTNVKFPTSHRQRFQQDSPFDGWSRVKSGAARISNTHKIDVVHPRVNNDSEITRPSSTPLPTSSQTASLLPRALNYESHEAANLDKLRMPLISSTGKVTRRPFDDADDVSSRSISTASIQAPSLLHKSLSTNDDKDTIISWLNPISKIPTLVNQRTGHTVPALRLGTERLTSYIKAPSKISCAQERSTSPWLTSLLEKWQNPVFTTTEIPIPQISRSSSDKQYTHGHQHHCTQLEIDGAFKEQSSGLYGRISKVALMNAQVIAQVDQKFILAVLPSKFDGRCSDATSTASTTLILIDQHAASERVLIESLLQDLCSPSSANLVTPLVFTIPDREAESFLARKLFLETWGVRYDIETLVVKGTIECQLRIRTLPGGIAERCIREPRLLIDFLRTEIHRPIPTTLQHTPHTSSTQKTHNLPAQTFSDTNDQNWLTRVNNCPQGLLDMLNSRACRSAVMFNDILTKDQCEVLVNKLAKCAFPFQCAHGRPSLVPVVELGVELSMGAGHGEDMGGFGRAMRKWTSEKSVGT